MSQGFKRSSKKKNQQSYITISAHIHHCQVAVRNFSTYMTIFHAMPYIYRDEGQPQKKRNLIKRIKVPASLRAVLATRTVDRIQFIKDSSNLKDFSLRANP